MTPRLPVSLALLAGCLIAGCLITPAPAAQISLPSFSAPAGSSAALALSFVSQGDSVSGLQFDLQFDSAQMAVAALLADSGRDAQKQIYSYDSGAGKRRFLIVGLNRSALADGALLSLIVSLKAAVPAGDLALKISGLVCSDPDGNPVSAVSTDGTVSVIPGPAAAAALALGGVLNAASLRSGAIAPGETITLIGASLAPAGGAGVSIGGTASPILYASSGQINAVVPYSVSGSTANLVVEAQGVKLAELFVPVDVAAPSVFTANATGVGPAAVLNEDGSPNGPLNPAPKGSLVSLFATGAGRMDPPATDGQIGDPAAKPVIPVTVRVGGTEVQPDYAGSAPGLVSGVVQVNFRLPGNAPTGWAVPLFLQVGSVQSPTGVTISIR